MVCYLLPAGLLLALSSAPFATLADEPSLTFNGYATLGLLHSSEERADYIPKSLRSRGAGRSGNPNVETDSLAALQVDYQAGSRLSATVQLVAEQDFRGDFRPRLEWANLQYSVSEDVEIRVGRIALNTFMVSDYRKVGFALPWVRLPAELYQLVGISNSDVVARLGGDEFIVLMPEVADADQVAAVAEKLLKSVSAPYRLAGASREITISIGISLYPHDGQDEETLIKRADKAMYEVKQSGRAGYRFYNEDMESGKPDKG